MELRSPEELAEDCRREAAITTDRQTRDGLLRRAADYQAQASVPGLLADALSREERIETFRDGYVFRPSPDLRSRQDSSDWGYWVCDIEDQERLAWSDRVYDLFGLPVGVPVDRDWAVARYLEHSRTTLQRVRAYALRHAFGFILDAEIEPPGRAPLWIRMLAVPVCIDGRVARLHGLKRAL